MVSLSLSLIGRASHVSSFDPPCFLNEEDVSSRRMGKKRRDSPRWIRPIEVSL